jgi:hypothetical protein
MRLRRAYLGLEALDFVLARGARVICQRPIVRSACSKELAQVALHAPNIEHERSRMRTRPSPTDVVVHGQVSFARHLELVSRLGVLPR